MKCPFCSYTESKVIDSRPAAEFSKIKRRRECPKCERRFTTYETLATGNIMVIKKDKSREPFDSAKIVRGMIKACEKRPISVETLEKAAASIEVQLQNSLEREVTSNSIGEYVMQALKNTDAVAYVRFASVYREFKDVGTFMTELSGLFKEK